MASEALSIPFDIPWKRLAWSRDMLDRRGSGLPPKWRSSVAVSAYPVPLEDTEDDDPDTRIVYFKVSTSITGWCESEALPGQPVLPDGLDPWQAGAWDYLWNQERLGEYWPCLTAILQVAVHPHGADDVADDDYPYIVDFEPKKRELYESVTTTGEVLSGSRNNVNVQKGYTSMLGTESEVSGHIGVSVGGFGLGFGGRERSLSSTETVDMKTTDTSVERRETAGISTQLSQMYQLFNGYHVGTNRGVFAMFARPHTVSEAEQVDNNLVNGDRRLEGVQDVFLVVSVPRTVPGLCVEVWLDTGHKHRVNSMTANQPDFAPSIVITRRIVAGCARFEDDRLITERLPPAPEPVPPIVVGEAVIDPADRFDRLAPGDYALRSSQSQVAAANHLNLLQERVRASALAAAASSLYKPRPYLHTDAFKARAANALRATRLDLMALQKLGYVRDDGELRALQSAGVATSGDVFRRTDKTPDIVLAVRERLLEAIMKALSAGRR